MAQAISTDELERRLRREFALANLAGTMAAVVRWDDVAADVEAAFRFAGLMQQFDELTSLFEELAVDDRFAGTRRGGQSRQARRFPSAASGVDGFVRSFPGSGCFYHWPSGLRCVTGPMTFTPLHRLSSYSCGILPQANRDGGWLPVWPRITFDVVGEPAPEDLEANEAIRTTLVGEKKRHFPVTDGDE